MSLNLRYFKNNFKSCENLKARISKRIFCRPIRCENIVMKLKNNICLCAYPESKMNVYKIFPEKSLLSRVNTNIECAVIWYL